MVESNAEVAQSPCDAVERLSLREIANARPVMPVPVSLVAIRQEVVAGTRLEEAAWAVLALSALATTALGFWSVR